MYSITEHKITELIHNFGVIINSQKSNNFSTHYEVTFLQAEMNNFSRNTTSDRGNHLYIRQQYR